MFHLTIKGKVARAIDMSFINIRFFCFRNLQDGEISTNAQQVFLIGENGQGKTNFLEALYYLSYGSSFRGSNDAEVATSKKSFYCLEAKTSTASQSINSNYENIAIKWTGKQKQYYREGKQLHDRKELIGLNPSIVFCHEDFSFAAGDPERRRFFFDQTASIVSLSYIEILRSYKRILKQRNSALKEGALSILELLDIQLIEYGKILMNERKKLETYFESVFSPLYENVSHLGVEVNVRYKANWPLEGSKEMILTKMVSRRKEELLFGSTLSGPHRDRWVFSASAGDFSASASTGQLRLLSLALRTCQASYFTFCTGIKPVLLIDDVLLELDLEKRRRFLEMLPGASQKFFTFLPGEPLEGYLNTDTIIYHVSNGRFAN